MCDMEGSGFGGLFGDPDELQRRLGEFAEQMHGAQRIAWADNAEIISWWPDRARWSGKNPRLPTMTPNTIGELEDCVMTLPGALFLQTLATQTLQPFLRPCQATYAPSPFWHYPDSAPFNRIILI